MINSIKPPRAYCLRICSSSFSFFVAASIGKNLPPCKMKKALLNGSAFLLWAYLGSNQGPPDYESGALTN